MESEIKRLNYFDGQFLKELEFRDEQVYHLHMRRRVNYVLFDGTGALTLESANDLKFVNVVGKTLRVQAGTAIEMDLDAKEGIEVVLRQDSAVLDLDAVPGVAASGTAWVTLHRRETLVKDPPSPGGVDDDTRVKEEAVVTVHASDPTAPPATGLDPVDGTRYVLLGSIDHGSMIPTYAGVRMEAKLRSTLVPGGGGGGTPPALGPAITAISHSSIQPGGTLDVTITGDGFADPATVTSSAPPAELAISNVNVAGPTSITLTLTAANNATPGSVTFQVSVPAGLASSGGIAAFSIVVPVEIIALSPASATAGSTTRVRVRGRNLHSGSLTSPSPATGTTVRLRDPNALSTVFLSLTPRVDPPSLIGGQQVQAISFALPPQATFDLSSLTLPVTEIDVRVEVEFGGSSDRNDPADPSGAEPDLKVKFQ